MALWMASCSTVALSRRRRATRRGRTAMKVRAKPMVVERRKTIVSTKRLPLWHLSEEMYMTRQLVPDSNDSWFKIRQQQGRMKEMIRQQQKKDMLKIEREIGGFRLPPTIPIGDIREGMWLDGRVCQIKYTSVMVDVGAYTERGEFFDGKLHIQQLRDDGTYVSRKDMMKEVYLGERVRVRVRKCMPTAGVLTLSLRELEELPPLFMGKPRPYSFFDLGQYMKVRGIVRTVWDYVAWVDIGCDRLARLHVSEQFRGKTRHGFHKRGQPYNYASQVWAVGSQLDDLWIRDILNDSVIRLTCVQPRSRPREVAAPKEIGRQGVPGTIVGPEPEERLTREEQRDKEKIEAEKTPYNPYVAHVDEWLEDAMEPNEEQDSWVAQTERELFAEEEAKKANQAEGEGEARDDDEEYYSIIDDQVITDLGAAIKTQKELEAEAEAQEDEFADDDFAEDDFAEGESGGGSPIGFGPNAFSASELDGWEMKPTEKDKEKAKKKPSKWYDEAPHAENLSVEQLESFFAEEDEIDISDVDLGDRSSSRG